MNTKSENLVGHGGNEWISGDGKQCRIYFNDLAARYGLSVTRYKTSRISSATLKGEKISNTKADTLHTTLTIGKLWYDVIADKFNFSGLTDEMAAELIASIEGSENVAANQTAASQPVKCLHSETVIVKSKLKMIAPYWQCCSCREHFTTDPAS